ncbi:cytochrome P450 [Rhizoctonia solani]|nr:cytochrome P450 [Rhizoctonia solani]
MPTESIQPVQCVAALGALTLAYYLVPYLRDPYDYRHRFSGPWLAELSSWWISYAALAGKQCDVIRKQHEKYGTFVRIGPNHISISDPDALEAVYGHRSGALKSDFYDNPGAGTSNVFSERNKVAHTKMRKRIANIFSQQNVLNFEPRVREHIVQLCEQWDLRCKEAVRGVSGSNWTAENGYAVMDCCSQFSYLTFDIIGDLALGAPFGLIQAQKDSSPVIESVDKFGQPEKVSIQVPVVEAIASINRNLASTGPFPLWTRYMMKILPWNIPSLLREIRFFKLAMAVVDARLKRGLRTMSDGSLGVDFIDKLLQVRNEDGSEMSRDELLSETLTMLLAGSDTSSNTLSSLCYYLAIHPDMQRELQSELDKHEPLTSSANKEQAPPIILPSDVVPDYEQIKNLPYLNACVKEALRIHSTIGMGLPRVVPPGRTLAVAGQTFRAGSVISVPSYMTNRSSIWGADASEFRPDRWLDENAGSLNKYFVPFSLGPRSCIGRNLAYMELMLIAATVFRRYSMEVVPKTRMTIDDTFIRAVVDCQVAFKRRDTV